MKFGLPLATLHPAVWVAVAREADRLGFDSVWIPEHLVIPVAAAGSPHAGEDHPPIPSDVPVFDAIAYLCHLAATTTRVRLGTYVYNIGLRHPFVVARAATTLDVVSQGRFEFGIGASWLRAEWDAIGLDFDRRGARVDESIEVCRRLWRDDVIEHHGEFFDFAPVKFEPKPVQSGGPPLHIGGDGRAALRRAATVGAGWMPMNHTLEQLPASLAHLGRLCEETGRQAPVEITLGGDVTARADVERYAEAGVDRVMVRPWTRTSEAIDAMRRFADDVF